MARIDYTSAAVMHARAAAKQRQRDEGKRGAYVLARFILDAGSVNAAASTVRHKPGSNHEPQRDLSNAHLL